MRWVILCLFLLQSICGAVPEEVEKQAGYLAAVLRQADEAYFNKNSSIMSDVAYDALRAQYERLVADFPELKSKDSVGVKPTKDKVLHSKPVLSLQKVYSDERLLLFAERCGVNQQFCIEPKIDGVAIVLRYRKGVLQRALTRGDGKQGSDVTAALIASGCAPFYLDNAPDVLDVRGEVFLPFKAFNALNERRKNTGQPLLKSPRNTAGGTLRLHDYAETARRGLVLAVFELIDTDEMPDTYAKAHDLLRSFKLPVVESRVVSFSSLVREVDALNRRRNVLPYTTDGVVIKVNEVARYNELGATARFPRGAAARKYKKKPIETKLLSVEWSTGATGRLTPIAHFAAVDMQGATIQSATLHNLNHLRAMDLRIGDWIQVIRAGGSVPEVVGVCLEKRTGREGEIPNPILDMIQADG